MGAEGWLNTVQLVESFPTERISSFLEGLWLWYLLIMSTVIINLESLELLERLVSKFDLPAKLLWALLPSKFGVFMWHPHSYRFQRRISLDLLLGRPCKVQSWVWSAELAVTLWVLSPRWRLGTHYRHSPTTAPSRKCSFFLCDSKLFSLTALRGVSPESKQVNMKNLINPGQPKPWEEVSGSPHPLRSWRAIFSWWF